MKHSVGHTCNGFTVIADLIYSDAAKRIAQQPHILELAEEALQTVTPGVSQENSIGIECDMGRPIGYSFVIATKETDNIFYAQPVRDNIYSRFVKNGEPLVTQYLTMILDRQDEDMTYELLDVWIGTLIPPRPGSDNETPESLPYWTNHAFILDNQQLQTRTITKACPYEESTSKVLQIEVV